MSLLAPFRRHRRQTLDLALVAPLVLCIGGATLAPVAASIGYSLVDPVSLAFPSLANYQAIWRQSTFREAVSNTLFITGVGLTLEMAVGLALALLLTRNFGGRGLARALLLLPMGVPTLVSGVVMSYLFSLSGYVNEALLRLGLVQVPVVWTGGGWLTLLTIVFADMWKVTPMVMLLLLTGLQAIPPELYEAADVDGVSTWQRFRLITWPLLQPAVTTALVLRAIDAFRIFDLAMVLAGRMTPVMTTYAYYEWAAYNNPYTSGAGATLLLALIGVFVVGYLRLAAGAQEEAE